MTIVADIYFQEIVFNIPNLPFTLYDWTLTSQYSHEPITLRGGVQDSNDRWSSIGINFPADFANNNKNGIYNWRLADLDGNTIQEGLAKIICDPGNTETETISYTSTPDTEERVADVYYRPNY